MFVEKKRWLWSCLKMQVDDRLLRYGADVGNEELVVSSAIVTVNVCKQLHIPIYSPPEYQSLFCLQ